MRSSARSEPTGFALCPIASLAPTCRRRHHHSGHHPVDRRPPQSAVMTPSLALRPSPLRKCDHPSFNQRRRRPLPTGVPNERRPRRLRLPNGYRPPCLVTALPRRVARRLLRELCGPRRRRNVCRLLCLAGAPPHLRRSLPVALRRRAPMRLPAPQRETRIRQQCRSPRRHSTRRSS
jgi:hypothetical protein